jgi:hypothetical protein
MANPKKPVSGTRIAELVRLSILSWSATLLTASYAGVLPKMDPTFIASIFTGSLAWYGIERRDRDKDENVGSMTRREVASAAKQQATTAVLGKVIPRDDTKG